MKQLLIALMCLCFTHMAAAGPLIKCKGADGKISFSDTPCPDRPGMKTLSAPPEPTASASSPRARSSGPYVPGKSPFTDKMLQALVIKCNQGEKEACRYAEKVRGGNYDFGNLLVDTAEESCAKGA